MKKDILKHSFYAHGKLLITGEYFVLDGAKALAVPTKFGQSLEVFFNDDTEGVSWRSFDIDKNVWFEGVFNDKTLDLKHCTDETVGVMLSKILKTAQLLNPHFKHFKGNIETHLTFPRNWGLGTSSTLIYNISQLFGVNPYTLLKETFGGSGYDIACAGVDSAIYYTTSNGEITVEKVQFQPPFKDNLYFVYLGKKQNSREGIARYREKAATLPPQYFDDILTLTDAFLNAADLKSFDKLIQEHENLVASVIQLTRAKTLYFNDFWGEVKSLGAWGGDFVMVTSDRAVDETKQYFNKKGFNTVLKYTEMVL